MLQYLDVSSNGLLSIGNEVFSGLSSLTVLDLSHNINLTFAEKAFEGLEQSLQDLRLANVSMNTIPASVSRLRNLEKLVLAHNNLRDNNDGDKIIAAPHYLQSLDLSYNRFLQVPSQYLKCFVNIR